MTPHPIDQEIQNARRISSVRAIVIPPCPESLLRLQSILAQPEPDAGALDQLASSDVAMAAALIRQAEAPQPVAVSRGRRALPWLGAAAMLGLGVWIGTLI